MSPSHRILARLSIRTKVPLVAGLLILVVGGALSTAAYLAMKRAAMERGGERLVSLAGQFHETFRGSIGDVKARAIAAARKPALARYLQSPSPAREGAALAALEYSGPQPELTLATELRDASGRVLLSAGRQGGPAQPRLPSLGERDSAPLGAALPELASPDSAAIGRLRQDQDSLAYPIAARIPSEPGGYLVIWRRVSNAPQSRAQIARIFGSEAAFHFGNADGSIWSDLGRATAPPPVDPARLEGLQRYSRRNGPGDVLAAAGRIPGTPWAFTIESPVHAVLAPTRGFLRTLTLIAALCVTIGLGAAALLSRRLTEPLRHLTDAADAIASGEVSRRVRLARADELGRLGASFDAMATQVEEARHRLEETVASRTRELNQALRQLQNTQESLVRREKLALLGQLAGGVSHELRNPLAVMSNAVYYLELIQPNPPEEVRQYLGILRDQIIQSAKIVDDLLHFSRTPSANRQPIPLRRILTAVMPQLPELDGITLEHEVPDTLPEVKVDAAQAGQVILNLLINAVQALEQSGSGGRITLRATLLNEALVALEVTDSGPGIPPELQGRIFEPLFTTKARGIGMGLSVSKTLAQLNGGDLTLAGGDGAGTTFVFTLPLAREGG